MAGPESVSPFGVVSGMRYRQIGRDAAVTIREAQDSCIRALRVVNPDTGEVELYCHCTNSEPKENAIQELFAKRF